MPTTDRTPGTTTTGRKITGTDYRARLDHSSSDGSIRDYTLLTADGRVLGRVGWHGARLSRTAGYHEGWSVPSFSTRTWDSLADAATALAAEVQA